MSSGGAGALMHAVDIEVRIEAVEGKEPVWAQAEEEAGNRIFDTVHAFVRDVFSGRVQVDRDRIETKSFTRTLAVFALPTASHASILQGDLTGLASRLATDLAAKFGVEHKQPVVAFKPIRAFLSEAAPAGAGAAGPSQQSSYGAAPMWNNDPSQSNNGQQPPPGAMVPAQFVPNVFAPYGQPQQPQQQDNQKPKGAWLGPTGVMLLGIMLGGFAIATGVLAVAQYETAQELEATRSQLNAANDANAEFLRTVNGAKERADAIQAKVRELTEEATRKNRVIDFRPIPNWGQTYLNTLDQYAAYLATEEEKLDQIPVPGVSRPPTRLPDQELCIPGVTDNKPGC